MLLTVVAMFAMVVVLFLIVVVWLLTVVVIYKYLHICVGLFLYTIFPLGVL